MDITQQATALEPYKGRCPAVQATITLRTGETYTARVPARMWRSRLMDRMPYGTDYRQAVWTKVRA
jgi:hypothetical protein